VITLFTATLRFEEDVVAARSRVRALAGALGWSTADQTRIVTAFSELVREALRHGNQAEVDVELAERGRPQPAQVLRLAVGDLHPQVLGSGPWSVGEARGQERHVQGARERVEAAGRLLDGVRVDPDAPGRAILERVLPEDVRLTDAEAGRLADRIRREAAGSPFEEMQRQNEELVRALAELRARTRELEDTNSGIRALLDEVSEKEGAARSAATRRDQELRVLAHELRSPLAAGIGLLRLLREEADEALADDLRQLEGLLAEGLRLTEDQLEAARTGGEPRLRRQAVDVAGLLRTVRGMTQPLVAGPDCELRFAWDDDLPVMATDGGAISQVLRNLVVNALKFTDRGHVEVRAQRLGKDRVRFTVTDTGLGIDPADHDRIFEEFEQVDGAQDGGRRRGTGLGLPLVRRLVGALGGSVELHSARGEGTTFVVDVPVQLPGEWAEGLRSVGS
jgi:signal transduction histidine kinase